MSTSPDNTFSHANYSRKQSIATNLLLESNSTGSSLDDMGTYRTTITLTKPIPAAITECELTKRNESNEAEAVAVKNVNDGDDDDEEEETENVLNGNASSNDEISECDSRSESESNKCDSRNEKNSIFLRNDLAINGYNDAALKKAGGYLIAVHRKLSRQDTYFLSYHKSRPSLFGVPLLIPCYENGTNKDLYCAVWIQVARLLSPLPATPPDQSNHATDW